MSSVIVRFTSKWPWNPGSWVVAHATGSSEFSHVMAIIDGLAYEATMLHGCRIVPVEEAMFGVVSYQDMTVDVPDIDQSVKFGELQNGHKYDFAGAFGLPFIKSDDWSDWRKWWCSELVFMMLGIGGNWILDPDEVHRVTPNDLHQTNNVKSNVVKIAT